MVTIENTDNWLLIWILYCIPGFYFATRCDIIITRKGATEDDQFNEKVDDDYRFVADRWGKFCISGKN